VYTPLPGRALSFVKAGSPLEFFFFTPPPFSRIHLGGFSPLLAMVWRRGLGMSLFVLRTPPHALLLPFVGRRFEASILFLRSAEILPVIVQLGQFLFPVRCSDAVALSLFMSFFCRKTCLISLFQRLFRPMKVPPPLPLFFSCRGFFSSP